jgi:hypothetical protein
MTSYLPIYYKNHPNYKKKYFTGNKIMCNIKSKKKEITKVRTQNNENINEKNNNQNNIGKKNVNENNKESVIQEIQKYFIQNLKNLHHFQILKKCKELNNIKKLQSTGNSYIGLLQNYIVKKKMPNNTLGCYYFNNEIKSLFALNSYNHFPKLISFDKKTLSVYMLYCGSQINYKNIPDNWLQQYNEIKNIFTKLKITSGDILKKNICVLNNIIFIIDFGLNSQFSENYQISLKKLYKILLNISYKKNYEKRF